MAALKLHKGGQLTPGVRWLLSLSDDDMRGGRSGNVLGALIAEIRCVNTLKQAFSGTEQDRRNGQMHLIYKSCT